MSRLDPDKETLEKAVELIMNKTGCSRERALESVLRWCECHGTIDEHKAILKFIKNQEAS